MRKCPLEHCFINLFNLLKSFYFQNNESVPEMSLKLNENVLTNMN